MNDDFTRKVMSQLKWRILDGVDPNPKNFVGCAVFQVEKGKTGCLLRLEPNMEKKVYPCTYQICSNVNCADCS
jgi:AP-2 complex subunit alpha